jgi:phospholipase C
VAAAIDHVIVIALENRSFDHMLGYLQHPDASFDGLLGTGPHENPGWTAGPSVSATPDAKHVLPLDPDHAHEAVMLQLGATRQGGLWQVDNRGFVESYERKGRGLAAPSFDGVLAPLVALFNRLTASAAIKDRGPLAMRCQASSQVPVLSELALKFGTCTRWFASVPGETWPNRNFLHAATSDGTTVNETRFYDNTTIFELLEKAGKSWHIYYDDTPQVWAFNGLWESDDRRRNWYRSSEFANHVRSGQLPSYSFIEPNHRPPLHIEPYVPVVGQRDNSNSQHPGNNLVADKDYEACPAGGPGDFTRAEALIAQVYEALRSNPEVFERSVLLVTYDEHGGLYDHVAPPGVPAPGEDRRPAPLARLLRFLLRRKTTFFDFTLLGVRVPAIVISPYVPAGAISTTPRDHASVPATLRAIFAPAHDPLTKRDEWAPPFHTMLTLDQPRTADLPDLSGHAAPAAAPAAPTGAAPTAPLPGEAGPEPPLPDHYQDLLDLADLVDRKLPGPVAPTSLGPRAKARHVTAEFQHNAEDAR